MTGVEGLARASALLGTALDKLLSLAGELVAHLTAAGVQLPRRSLLQELEPLDSSGWRTDAACVVSHQ